MIKTTTPISCSPPERQNWTQIINSPCNGQVNPDSSLSRLSNLVKKHQPPNKSIFDEQEKYQKERDKKIAEERQNELDKKTAEELKAAGVRLDPRFKHPQPYLKKH